MQRPGLDTLACVNPECQRFRLTGQDNLTVRKVYGHDHIRLLRCRTCSEEFSAASFSLGLSAGQCAPEHHEKSAPRAAGHHRRCAVLCPGQHTERRFQRRLRLRKMLVPLTEPRTVRRDLGVLMGQHALHFGPLWATDAGAAEHH